jgi:DNA-binding transcriptional LysR family regulator
MDTLFSMQLFLRVVQAGSFSAAGRQVGLSPASVFRHINALEDRLGTRLLNRTSRKLSMTEAGALYCSGVDQILAEMNDIETQVAQLQVAPHGTLRVHCRMSLGAQHLAPALPAFLARYPDLRIDLSLTDRCADLAEENIDVAIRIGKMPDSPLLVRKIASSTRIVCASPAYLDAHATPEHPTDLAAHNCLAFRGPAAQAVWRFLDGKALIEMHVSGSLQADNAEVLRLAALGGLGVALLPEWCIGADLKAGRLRALLPGFEATPFSFDSGIYVVTQKSRHRSMKVQLFIDFLIRLFRERGHWADALEQSGLHSGLADAANVEPAWLGPKQTRRGPAPPRAEGRLAIS